MFQSNFFTQIRPQFYDFIFQIFVFSSLIIHCAERYHIDKYVILFLIYPSSATVNTMRVM